MFFSDWQTLVGTVVTGLFAYTALVLFLRISGKRTLSKMNAFDFVITVALGSTLASVLVSPDVALAEGVLALAVLIVLQYVVAWSGVRFAWARRTFKSEPALLLRRGEFLGGAMRRERVSRDEVLAAVRSEGIAALGDVHAVVLETDGSFSVIREDGSRGESSLVNVADEGRDDGQVELSP